MAFKHIHLNISFLMKQKGLTPITLGEKTNVSKSSIYSYIDGKRKPNKKSLEKLATFFEVSPLDLENNQLYSKGYREADYNKPKKINLLEEAKPSYSNQSSTFQVDALRNLEKIIILLEKENINEQNELSYLLDLLKILLEKEAIHLQFQANKIKDLLQENARLKNN